MASFLTPWLLWFVLVSGGTMAEKCPADTCSASAHESALLQVQEDERARPPPPGHVFKASCDATHKVYRYVGPGDHMYTKDWNELSWSKYGYTYEATEFKLYSHRCAEGSLPPRRDRLGRIRVIKMGVVPLYRLWSLGRGDHYYTLATAYPGYTNEGVLGYCFPKHMPGTSPLYHYWSWHAQDNFYTPNFKEIGNGAHGYTLIGVVCYVVLI